LPLQVLKNIDRIFETLFEDEPTAQEAVLEMKNDDGQNETMILGLTEFKKTAPPLFALLPSTAKLSGEYNNV